MVVAGILCNFYQAVLHLQTRVSAGGAWAAWLVFLLTRSCQTQAEILTKRSIAKALKLRLLTAHSFEIHSKVRAPTAVDDIDAIARAAAQMR